MKTLILALIALTSLNASAESIGAKTLQCTGGIFITNSAKRNVGTMPIQITIPTFAFLFSDFTSAYVSNIDTVTASVQANAEETFSGTGVFHQKWNAGVTDGQSLNLTLTNGAKTLKFLSKKVAQYSVDGFIIDGIFSYRNNAAPGTYVMALTCK